MGIKEFGEFCQIALDQCRKAGADFFTQTVLREATGVVQPLVAAPEQADNQALQTAGIVLHEL